MVASNSSLSPKLKEIIVEKKEFFEQYEAFIDFHELERLIERRGKLAMPELALHVVRVRGQKIIEIYRNEAALSVAQASFLQTAKAMEQVYSRYEKIKTSSPELAGRCERMMLQLLDQLESQPSEDYAKFKGMF